MPRLLLAVGEIDVQIVEDPQYLEGVRLHPTGNQGNCHRTWQGHPVASFKPQIQIVNPRSEKPPSFLVTFLLRGGAQRASPVHWDVFKQCAEQEQRQRERRSNDDDGRLHSITG